MPQKTNKKLAGSKTQPKRCSTCRKAMSAHSISKTCDACKKRAAANRAKARASKIECQAKKDDGTKCTNKVNKDCGNKYCAIHRNEWLREKELAGKKNIKECKSRTQCNPDKPGIKAILPKDYPYDHCDACRERARLKDKERRDAKKKIGQKLKNKNLYICTECPIYKKYKKKDMGIRNDGGIATLCKKHFEIQKKIEATRPKDRIRKDNRTKEQPREKSRKEREEHPDRLYERYTKSREKKLLEDPVGYRKRNAENQRKRRERLGLSGESTRRYKTNPKDKYRVYKTYAKEKNYDFDITFEEFEKILKSDCYYCGCTRNKILNGIDRLDNTVGYIKGNVVPACKICNYMKNSLNEATFILMCMHIATVNKFYKTKEFFNIFNNYQGVPYNRYKIRALNIKNIPFEISEEEFNKFRNTCSCYICKRNSNNDHRNGIDRINNKEGYTLDNCRSCCADCNFMKKDMDHDDFLLQCGLIAHQHKKRIDELLNMWTPSKATNKNNNKLSDEQIQNLRQQNKEEKFRKTLESKSEEARKKRMEEIRKKKNLANSRDIVIV